MCRRFYCFSQSDVVRWMRTDLNKSLPAKLRLPSEGIHKTSAIKELYVARNFRLSL